MNGVDDDNVSHGERKEKRVVMKTDGGGGEIAFGGDAAIGASTFLMITNPCCSINFRKIRPSLFNFTANPSFYSHHFIHLRRPPPNISISRTARSTATTSCSRWDSNAETTGPRNFRGKKSKENDGVKGEKRRWWSGKPKYMEEEEEEEKRGILEEAIDSLFILKVFRSYGWLLPAIILSLLSSCGPKAFLSSFAIFFGLSLVIFAFQKLFGWPEKKRRKRRKRYGRSRRRDFEMGGDDERQNENQEPVTGKMGSESTFGGWDELGTVGSARGRPREPRTAVPSRTTPMADGKFSKRRRESDTPLLLRLLIAVFPFLASWTKML